MLFSALIPNFFFKVSNTRENDQLSNIPLDKEKVLFKITTKNLISKPLLNKSFLLLALKLQKASNLLFILDTNNQTDIKNYENFILNLDLIPNYSGNLLVTIFLSTNKDYNNYYDYEFNLRKINKLYDLSNHKNYLDTYTSSISFLALFNSGFNINKLALNNISRNLTLSKQNRWMWKSSIFDDKSFSNLSTVTHLKKILFNSELSTSANNRNI